MRSHILDCRLDAVVDRLLKAQPSRPRIDRGAPVHVAHSPSRGKPETGPRFESLYAFPVGRGSEVVAGSEERQKPRHTRRCSQIPGETKCGGRDVGPAIAFGREHRLHPEGIGGYEDLVGATVVRDDPKLTVELIECRLRPGFIPPYPPNGRDP